MSEATLTTRYDKVKEILSTAAGNSTADYGGIGRFWELPLDELLEARIHSIRLISPEATSPASTSGCGCGCGTASAQSPAGDAPHERRPPYPGRGDSSGLIQGLRGLAPFDGSRFPPLPWGGKRLSGDDIDFISDWIDDGCPAADREIASIALDVTSLPTTFVQLRRDNVEAMALETFDVSPSEYHYQRGETKQRVNIDCMSDTQIEKLRYAFRAMYELNKWPEDRRSYNNMAQIHQNHCQHGWERFLPWHRIYLYEFEQALQDQVPDVTLPYWDWTMPQYRPECPVDGLIIPKSLQAFLTADSLRYLQKARPSLPQEAADILLKQVVEPAKLYTSQKTFFDDVSALIGSEYAEGDHRHRFIDALLGENSLWYPLRYPAEYPGGITINQAVNYHYPTANDMAQIMSLRTFRDFGGGSIYNDSFGYLDQNPHNTMHLWTGGMNPDYHAPPQSFQNELGADRNRGVRVAGRQFHSRSDMYTQPQFGDMFSNLTASYDPVFWPIHVNIDRIWSEWQQEHAASLPADQDSVLTPWSYTIADTLDISRFGYEYVKSSYVIPVGLDAPVGRFVSRAIAVPDAVRATFRDAEVRMHRIPQLPRSCFIRVFLNLPDANASTSITDPHYAGYLAIFGHGECYGGPGHCAIPGDRRKYDLRPRSHNTPRNHRINVSRSVRRLIDEGATSVQITLVVIGADYCEDNELLRLEGVSLNFLD